MLMLTSYMDEAGHYDDPNRHYVGMAGFVAPVSAWGRFASLWLSILKEFKLTEPFHMKDFAHFKKQFASGWRDDKVKREKLFGLLIKAIQETKAVPIAAIVSVEDFNSLTECQRVTFVSPYHISFQVVTRGAALQAMGEEPEKVAMVYSYNQEYGTVPPQQTYSIDQAGNAEQLWQAIKAQTDFGRWMGAYASSTPAEVVPLQAADVFAYELAKEFETLAGDSGRDMRWGLQQILKMANFPYSMIRLFDRKELLRQVREGRFPCQTGTDEINQNQESSAHKRLLKWMEERGKVERQPNAFEF